ncbi:winged helix DNA-binding domain-containing protein [Hyalangium sp.]|uniref:winged helix DNA-binding domain-containing protein n=1 Tax=Hyalangium sp. TaxID=2028555 RepID=UPI002D73A195|nr:winged helix DNA-binding domain-containing protein [Hyalangium sp.]HYH97120.1 winged helix DNA-binding domain-containing protein [Hyalangium sp.]
MPVPTLTRRALNRATLARQMLLAREKTPVLRAIERLVGLQAQLARPPFIGLWSRVQNFQSEQLTRLLQSRKVVRATMMRATLHLVSTKDYVKLRAAIQPVLRSSMQGILRERAQKLDVDQLSAEARKYFDEEPRNFDELRDHLLQRFPKGDERAMGYAVRMHLPLVQVPTDTEWGYPGTADFAVAESWLGEPLGTDETPHALILRYLAAFGPASVTDAQTWSGLGGLKLAFEELRPKLKTFRDERGRELFDLPKAPRPPEDTPAPVRFLPDYDNLILAHDDRTRLMEKEHRSKISTSSLRILPTFLVDGFVAGTWKLERKKTTATLVIEPFTTLSKKPLADLTGEGRLLARFIEDDAIGFDVHVTRPSFDA